MCRCRDEDDGEDDGEAKEHGAVGMLAQALQQSGLIGAVGQGLTLHVDDVRRRVRLAKAMEQTVSVTNGCLYIDYRFVGYVSPEALAELWLFWLFFHALQSCSMRQRFVIDLLTCLVSPRWVVYSMVHAHQ